MNISQSDEGDYDLPSVDLRTLLGEMAALKAEVRAVTVEARESRQLVMSQTEALSAEVARASQREERLAQTLVAERRAAAQALITVAEKIDAALRATRAPAPVSWWQRFKGAPPTEALDGLRQGLELTLRTATERLAAQGVTRIRTVGAPFDADTMEAVRADRDLSKPNGVVLDEFIAGWRDSKGVLRTAQVVVNRLS